MPVSNLFRVWRLWEPGGPGSRKGWKPLQGRKVSGRSERALKCPLAEEPGLWRALGTKSLNPPPEKNGVGFRVSLYMHKRGLGTAIPYRSTDVVVKKATACWPVAVRLYSHLSVSLRSGSVA